MLYESRLNLRMVRLLGALCLGALALASCGQTQRIPGPLWLESSPAGEQQTVAQGAPVGSVIRHASPVWLRRPGASAGSQMAYYDKRARVQAGSEVRVGFGGRAELLWPDRASSIVLFNSGEARFGDTSQDEPLVELAHLGRAQITLAAKDRVRLPGGVDLRGDGSSLSGPILVDAIGPELMRLKNQSKQICQVRYRGSAFELLGGETLDLPLLLAAGGQELDPLLERVLLGDLEVYLSPGLQPEFDGSRLRVHADRQGTVVLGGFVVHLEAGEDAIFSDLGPIDASAASNSGSATQE